MTSEAAPAFLAPSLRDLMPDPLTLKDMAPAADRLLQAVARKERIAIFADYDVDGGASAALLLVWLRHFGIPATLYIPDRIDEGYGPNVPAMTQLAAAHDLILCVDCGTLSHDPIAAARGADVVILDHHLALETLPAALAVVNPNRQDEDGSLAHLCAAGVLFLLLVEANRRLKQQGTQGPDLMALLDLVALATVARATRSRRAMRSGPCWPWAFRRRLASTSSRNTTPAAQRWARAPSSSCRLGFTTASAPGSVSPPR